MKYNDTLATLPLSLSSNSDFNDSNSNILVNTKLYKYCGKGFGCKDAYFGKMKDFLLLDKAHLARSPLRASCCFLSLLKPKNTVLKFTTLG